MAGHFVGQHFAAIIGRDGPPMQSPNINNSIDTGTEVSGTLGMGSHRVEVTSAKRNALSVTSGRYVIELICIKVEVGQHFVETFLGQNLWIASANALHTPGEPFRFAISDVQHNRLDRSGPQINSCCNCHGWSLIQCAKVRCAKVAAPSAPV